MTTYRNEFNTFEELRDKRSELIINIQKLVPNYYHIRASSVEVDNKWHLMIEVDHG